MVFIRSGNLFSGFITVGEKKYCYEINMLDNSFKNQGSLKLDWRLKRLLGSSLNIFLEKEFHDAKEFYNQFCDFVKANVKTNKQEAWLSNPLETCALVKVLKEEIENSGEFIKSVDVENGIIGVEKTDPQLRSHKAILKLSPREPFKVIHHDLPLQSTDLFQNNFDLNTSFSISEFCKKFSLLVENFQQFWNTVALLDSQCCVLDPLNPSYKDNFRRIKITDTLSVVLKFNPMMAWQRPNITLLGCQSDVNFYEDVLQKNLENDVWDDEEDILYNLSNVLEITLPNKTVTEDVDLFELVQAEECAICFVWRLNDEIPNEVCEIDTCKSMYHSTCLFSYLSSLPRHQDYFGKIQGECPNCNNIISCTVPKFTL